MDMVTLAGPISSTSGVPGADIVVPENYNVTVLYTVVKQGEETNRHNKQGEVTNRHSKQGEVTNRYSKQGQGTRGQQ